MGESMALNTQGTGHHIRNLNTHLLKPTQASTKLHSQWTETNWRSVETQNEGVLTSSHMNTYQVLIYKCLWPVQTGLQSQLLRQWPL